MGKGIFKNLGVDIAAEIHKNISPGVLPAVLTKVENTGINAADPTGPPSTSSVDHDCRGFIGSQNRRSMDGTLILDGTVAISIVGDSLSGGTVEITAADTVSIEGKSYSIETVDRDPDQALWTLICRPR